MLLVYPYDGHILFDLGKVISPEISYPRELQTTRELVSVHSSALTVPHLPT